MLLGSSNRLRYYYDNILRQDLLLKLNYTNINNIPRLCKINILSLPPVGPTNNIKSVSLALEIICGQKVICTGGGLQPPFRRSTAGRREAYRAVGGRLARERSALKKKGGAGGGRGPREKARPLARSASRQLTTAGLAMRPTTVASLLCSVHTHSLYNFLEKLLTLQAASSHYIIQIQGQEVQITLGTREVRLFPEIQNHFEFFESVQNLQIKLVTSANNEYETRLIWTGLNQK